MKKYCLLLLLLSGSLSSKAQSSQQMVRLAKIEVAPNQLELYNNALKEQMQVAIKKEPGVLTYYAVAEKQPRTVSPFLKFMLIAVPICRTSKQLIS